MGTSDEGANAAGPSGPIADTNDRKDKKKQVEAGPWAFPPLLRDPAFDGVRADPRCADLLRRAKLT